MRRIWDLISYFFGGYKSFEGRCTRPSFFVIITVYLAMFIAVTFLSLTFTGAPRQIIFWGFVVSTFVPLISLLVRRLHDFNITGYAVIALLPLSLIGGLAISLLGIIIIGLIPTTRGTNKFGDDARGSNISVFD